MPPGGTLDTAQLARALDGQVSGLTPVGGGDICRAYKATTADGRAVFIKTRPGAPRGFFATEADGLRAARDNGSISAEDTADIHRVIDALPGLAGPLGPPSLIHGDLWAGNVVWGADGHNRLVDPAAHGGHRETDLAMLALFGLPHLEQVLSSYHEAWPLADGWRERVPLHQLHPVLVHAVLFGGSYGTHAGELARRALRAG